MPPYVRAVFETLIGNNAKLGRTFIGTTFGNIASIYSDQGNYPKAIAFHEKALVIRREMGDPDGEATALNNLATIYQSQGNLVKATEVVKQALKIAVERGDRSSEITYRRNLGSVQEDAGKYTEAMKGYEQMLALARQFGQPSQEAELLSAIAFNHASQGQYAKALIHYQQALKIHQDIGELNNVVMTTTSIGGVYNRLGQFQQAQKRLYQALTVAQQIGSRSIEPTLYSSIAFAYREQRQFEQARRNLQKSLNVARTIGSLTDESQALAGIGKLYLKQAQPENAIKVLQQALKIQRQTGVVSRQADTLSFIGQAQTQLGRYPEAQTTLQQSLNIATEIGDRSSEGITLSNIGNLFLQTGKATLAEKPLFEAIEIWESLRPGLTDSNKVSLFESQSLTYRLLQQSLVIQQKNEKALEISERSRARALVELLASRLAVDELAGRSLEVANQQATVKPSIAQIRQIAQAQNATLVQDSIVSDKDLYIWVVQPNGKINFHKTDLGAVKAPLNQLVADSRTAIGARGRADIEVSLTPEALKQRAEQQDRNLRQLHQLLIEPIAGFLPPDPNRPVIFIPQGELFLVPFPALKDAKGKFLIDHYTTLTAPSIQVLELTQQQQQRVKANSNASQSKALVVGDPVMPKLATIRLTPLLGARQEAKTIAQLFNTEPLIGWQLPASFIWQLMDYWTV